ncbi:PrsW family intramembrane metalloprotease [Salinarimonas soli]|uniref:PrsW family intramembrane metalloprotease n=1 Tax=Salinarimonas soli TaxID=1638099 RepID=A0A5B2V9N5_9HYPH|nr:PrsW family intramembrane metalloprotease [Salinarimonas soli]KAA2234957.1 PrsW family intramembrane metalloprotease [Salinarimonas soli]
MKIDPNMPPLPRDHAAPSLSEIVPFSSRNISLRKSGFLAPGLATVLLCVYLFSLSSATQYAQLLSFGRAVGFYILFMIFWLVYAYSGSRKPLWAFLAPALLTAILMETPIWTGIAALFRDVLPGGKVPDAAPFTAQFKSMFFGAGLPEELFKALPLFLGIGIALWLQARPAAPGMRGRILDGLAVRTPLDGVLVGLACGAAFIAMETFFEYYTNQIQRVSRATSSDSLGFLFGLQLLIPRTLQSLSGHMGWSAIMGYFVGLAFARRRMLVPLILGGWLAASLVHGLWNSVGHVSPVLYYAVAVFGFVLFLACLMKAKQLEPSFTGQAMASTGSIVVGVAPRPAAPPRPAPTPVAPPMPAPPAPPVPPMPPAPVPIAVADTLPVLAPYSLLVEGEVVPLAGGAHLDLSALPGLGGRGAGIVGEVTTHPADPTVLGLKNLSGRPWRAVAADGTAQEVPPDRNLRLGAGTRIAFGPLSGDIRQNQTA